MPHDLHNHIQPKMVIPPAAGLTNANTPWVGTIVDSQGYDSVEYVILSGNQTDADATFTVLLEDGDAANLSDAATIPANLLLGTAALASFTFASDNKVFKLGTITHKRYTRLTVTPAANDAGTAFVAAVAILGHAQIQPTPNPPT